MRAIGRTIRLMVRELSGTSMATNTKANGREIKPTATVNTLTATVPPTRACGEMTFNMAKE